MRIDKHLVVSMHYTLSDKTGNILDSSEENDPLCFLAGADQIIPGLEKELMGLSVGDKKQVTVSPEDGYGERDEDMIQVFNREELPDTDQLEIGEVLEFENEEGHTVEGSVLEISQENVTVDFNHPLAGETLHFQTEIIDIRKASPEEIAHGHVH
jgi:FKBP-type peptidyl-prolyl cis-trans isomerase SlyD